MVSWRQPVESIDALGSLKCPFVFSLISYYMEFREIEPTQIACAGLDSFIGQVASPPFLADDVKLIAVHLDTPAGDILQEGLHAVGRVA